MDNAIITKENINALQNKELKKNLNAMSTAVLNGNKASWLYAFHLTNIINGEQFVDDFKTQTAFAKFIDTSKGTITQYTKAVEFVKKMNLVEFDENKKPLVTLIPCTLFTAYLFSTIPSEDFNDFMVWLWDEKHIENPYGLSVRKLKALMKEYFTEEEEEEETESTEAENTEAESTAPTREDIIETIKEMMKEYDITIEDLK